MTDKNQTLEKLNTFRKRDKFSPSAWNDRGLNPSDSEMCNRLESLFNQCADSLIAATSSNASTRQYKKLLKNELSNFRSFDYDTEEREFICDYFFQLSNIVEVDFKEELNSWLYGKTLNFLFKLVSFLRGKEKVLETLSQNCTNCNAKLDTFIIRKEEGIEISGWIVVQCNNCNEYNLIESPPNAKQMRFGNYKWVEALSKDTYNEEGAKARLDQIKFFRKK